MQRLLKASVRKETGKEAARRVRKNGRIPGVLYGHGFEPLPLDLDSKEFYSLLRKKGGAHGLVELKIEGKKSEKHTVVIKEVQRHPIRDHILHVDFQKIKEEEKIHSEVSIRYIGEPVGVKMGGILQHFLYDVKVECLPKDLPEYIEVDISKLKLHDSLKVSDLPVIENVHYLNNPNEIIVSIIAKRIKVKGVLAEEEAAAEAVEEAAAESAEEATAREEAGVEEPQTQEPREGE